jgi:hypothetical protein
MLVEVYLNEGTPTGTRYKKALQTFGVSVYDCSNWRDKFEDITWSCFISFINLHKEIGTKLDLHAGIDIGLCKYHHMFFLIIVDPINKDLKEALDSELGKENLILITPEFANIAASRIGNLMSFIAADKPKNSPEIQDQINRKKEWRRTNCELLKKMYSESADDKEDERDDYRISSYDKWGRF